MHNEGEMVEPDWATIPEKFGWFAVDGFNHEAYYYCAAKKCASHSVKTINCDKWHISWIHQILGK